MSKALGESIMGARLFATMPNQKQNNPGPTIDQQIDQLVAGMTEATAELDRQIEEANLPDEAFEAAASIKAVEQPEAKEVAPTTEVSEVSEEAEIDETVDEPEAVEEVTASLDVQVDAMLEDAAASVEAATESRSTVDAVDEELSELADEMLDGDFDDADTVLAAGIEAPTQAAPDPDDQTDAESESEPAAHEAEAIDEDDLLDGDFDDADEVIAQGVPEAPQAKVEAVPAAETQTPEPEPVAAAPKPEPKPEPAPEAKIEPKAKVPKPAPSAEVDDEAESETEIEPSAKKTERKVRHKKPTKPRKGSLKQNSEGQPRWRVFAEDARERTGEAAYIVAEKLTKPLDSRPEMLKGLTGWLAAVTLFNAIAVWVFILVVRGPTVGTSAHPAVDLAGQQTNAATHNEEID